MLATTSSKLSDLLPKRASLLWSASFQQGWRSGTDPNFRPAQVRFFADSSYFYVHARLEDRVIGNSARGHNERTWLTGDVFEIFIQTDSDTYYEFHVTPENQNLFLRWTTEGRAKRPRKLEEFMIPDPDFIQTETEVCATEEYWEVWAGIPHRAINFPLKGVVTDLKVAFARYDTTPGEAEPVLSASAPFARKNYHERGAWQRIAWPPIEESVDSNTRKNPSQPARTRK